MIESRNIEKERRRSRGAGSNETGRFERLSRVEIDDGWEREGEAAGHRATVAARAKNRNDVSVNVS